jgi:hypothetical protein
MTLTSTTSRLSVWLLLLVACSSLLNGANAVGNDDVFMNVWSGDESMKQVDCAKTITHPDINSGKPTIVDDAISATFATCIHEGSNGAYEVYDLDHYTVELATTDYNMAQQQELLQETDSAHRRLPTCPPSCGGWTCGSNCNLCCLACGQRMYCGGQCQSCRRRLGAPEEPSFLDEVVNDEEQEEEEDVRSLTLIKSTRIIIDPIAEDCRDELRVLATKLNSVNNFCLGIAQALQKVTPVITL